MYKYKLSSTDGNSSNYGVCDICNKNATEVFHQIEKREYFNPITKKISLTQHNCKSYFGHKECLESKQR